MALPKSQPSAIIHWRPRKQLSTETMAHIGALDEQMSEAGQSDDDEVGVSVGVQLNDQLMAAAEGEIAAEGPLDEWLKYMTGREVDRDSVLQAIRAGQPPPTVLESFRAHNEAVVAAASSTMLSDIQSITSTPHAQQGYGSTTEETLAILGSRIQA